jgi:hypothetical protein
MNSVGEASHFDDAGSRLASPPMSLVADVTTLRPNSEVSLAQLGGSTFTRHHNQPLYFDLSFMSQYENFTMHIR